jgi:multidrug efflux pump subunit AcrB
MFRRTARPAADDGPQNRRQLDAGGRRRNQRGVLPDIRKLMPAGVNIKPIFDQSIFVKAALNGVLMGRSDRGGADRLMILLFLGNWRLTLIILISIPLSIITAILVMYWAARR